MSLGVVVLSSGRTTSLDACLEALSVQGKPIEQIVVVRRATKSAKTVDHARFPDGTIVVTGGTRARALNTGAAAIDTDVLAFLDGDTQVAPDWAEAILQAVADGGVVIAGTPSVVSDRSPVAGVGDPEGRNGFLPWAPARNLAVTSRSFAELGGFEAALPALEDADLCFRAQLRGWALHRVPAAAAISSPARGRALDRTRAGRAEELLQWRFRANPYFAVLPRVPDQTDPLRQFGRRLGRAELFLGQRPVPDVVLSSDADRYAVMPISPSPRALVIVGEAGDLAEISRRFRDRHDLSLCAPGLEADALTHWDEPAPWALQLARSASRAGWKFNTALVAKRLEQEHPRTWGEAFLLMGAVLAWYQGRAGYALAVHPGSAAALTAQLPGVPVVEVGSPAGARELLLPEPTGRSQSGRPGPVPRCPAGQICTPYAAADRRVDDADLLSPPDPLVFVSGCPRSGTSMLRNMLAAHPALAMPPEEAYFVTRVYGQLKARGRTADVELAWELIRADPHFRAWHLDVAVLDAAIGRSRPRSYAALIRTLFAATAASQGRAHSADKCTSYSMHWEWLAEQFPTSRFVHLLRDPRDVCASLPLQFFHHGGVAGAAWWWLLHVREAPRAAAALGSRWLEIRYEDLVGDPVRQLHRICDHVGILYDEQMISYADQTALPAGSHRHTARQSPQPGHRGGWRRLLDHDDLVTIERITGRLMRRYGYEPETTGVTLGAAAMSAKWILEEARYQWLLCGAPRPAMFSNLLGARWRAEV